MTRVRETLNSHPGRTDVHICLEFPSGEKVFLDTDIQYKVTCDESLIKALEHTLGENSVYVVVSSNACRKPKRNPQYRKNDYNNGG